MPICFSSLGNFERQIEALISRHMYVSKKFVFTSGRREGGGGGGGRSRRVYLICSKSATYSPNSGKNKKLLVNGINYRYAILCFSFHFVKILIL